MPRVMIMEPFRSEPRKQVVPFSSGGYFPPSRIERLEYVSFDAVDEERALGVGETYVFSNEHWEVEGLVNSSEEGFPHVVRMITVHIISPVVFKIVNDPAPFGDGVLRQFAEATLKSRGEFPFEGEQQ